jgi:hypothetical protein
VNATAKRRSHDPLTSGGPENDFDRFLDILLALGKYNVSEGIGPDWKFPSCALKYKVHG